MKAKKREAEETHVALNSFILLNHAKQIIVSLCLLLT